MQTTQLKNILEAVLLGADRTLTVNHLEALFELDEERPSRDEIRKALHDMSEDYESRGYELKQVASGYRLQVKQEYATWVGRLWEERPARYTRALLETMALIAYRQPITRGEIEEVRGVSVSSNIIKTLLERDWIKVLGHKDVPGKPSLYGTTKTFLDYFNLKSLDQLPTLAEIKDLDSINPELALDEEHDDTQKDGQEGEQGSKQSDDQSDDDQSTVGQSVTEQNDEQVSSEHVSSEQDSQNLDFQATSESDDVNVSDEVESTPAVSVTEVISGGETEQLQKEDQQGENQQNKDFHAEDPQVEEDRAEDELAEEKQTFIV